MSKTFLRKTLALLTVATMVLSNNPMSFSVPVKAANLAAPVEADWNTTYQTMDGVGSAYAYTASTMMLQLATAGYQDTVRHLLDLTFDDKDGTGHDIVRVIIGSGGTTASGTAASPGFNPKTGLLADVSNPGYDVGGNPIPVVGASKYGQYGYKMGTWNRIYDGQSDSIWPNEPEHTAGTMVPVQDFVWDYNTWNKPIGNDDGGPVNWSEDNKPGSKPVVIKNSPRTRKEIFDIDQIWTMKQAMQYGVNTFYACMWEAPYWMSKPNNQPANNTPTKIIRDDTTPDGKKIYYQAYADYLVNYIKGYWEQWGIPITHINPWNEIDLAGLGNNPGQFGPAYLRELIDEYIGPTLDKALEPGGALYGIKNPDGKEINFVPQLCAMDGCNVSGMLNIGSEVLPKLDPATGKHKYLDVATTHLYGTISIGTDENKLTHKDNFANAPFDYTVDTTKWPEYLKGYKIWQGEFMNQDTGNSSSGAYTQRYGNQNINDAVRYAHLMTNMFTSNPGINAYLWWITWDNNGADGSDLIRLTNNGSGQNAGHAGTLTGEYRLFKRFYGFGHFSRFTEPGDLRFGVTREPATNMSLVGYKSSDNKDFSITVTNSNNDDSIQPLEFTLKDFPVGTKSVTVFRTSGSENQKKLAEIPVENGKFVIGIPSASIVTIVPSEGNYATYNGLTSERDIFSSLEAEGNDNGIAGTAAGNAGRANEAVLLGDNRYLAYKNINFADGSANGGIIRRHLLYLTAQSRAVSGEGGSLLAYVLPVGTPVSSAEDILSKGTRVAEILVPKGANYGKYQAKVDTGDQSAYGHKDLYIVAALGGSDDMIAVDRFLFGANDSDWSTAANTSVASIKGNLLSNGDFDTTSVASAAYWSTGRYNNGTFEQTVTGPVLSSTTAQNYSGLSRYLNNGPSSSQSAGSGKVSGRISADGQYDGLWQDVTGKMTKGERYRFEGYFLSLKDGSLGYEVAADNPGDVEAMLVYYDAAGNQLAMTPIGGRDIPQPLGARESGERAWWNGNTLVGSILDGGPVSISSFQPVDIKVAKWAESNSNPFIYSEPNGTAKVALALYAKDANIFYSDELSIVPAPDRDTLRDALKGYKGNNSDIINEARTALIDSSLTQATVEKLVAALPVDKTLPTWAQGSTLTASNVSYTGLKLTWSPAQDDTKVAGYRIYKGSDIIATVAEDVYQYEVTGLSSGTSYEFSIQAGDTSNNWSSNGPSTYATTYSTGGGRYGGGSASTATTTPTPTPTPTPTSTVTSAVTPTPASASGSNQFKDIGSNFNWASEAINALYKKGIIKGTSDTTFDPGRNITRADFVVLLVRALGLKANIDSNFGDVDKNAYYYEAVGIAKKLGIATGIDGINFNPRGEISRQDMMVLAARALKTVNKLDQEGTAEDLSSYSDASNVAGYAVSSIAALVKEGIIKGNGNSINPAGTATRAETAVIIYRIYNKR